MVAAGGAQPLGAVVLDGNGNTVEEARVEWHVAPPDAGRISLHNLGTVFVAGQRPGIATIQATSGDSRSELVEVHVWPHEGLRAGFRGIGEGYPLIPPPGPHKLRGRRRDQER